MTHPYVQPSASQHCGSVSLQPSGSVSSQPPAHPNSDTPEPPKKKRHIRFDNDGNHVGDNSARFTTKAGKYIRSTIPIIFYSWKTVPVTFKNKLWERLEEKFIFSLSPRVIRPFLDKKFASIWTVAKSHYRTTIREAESFEDVLEKRPDGVDPNHWREFIIKQGDPKVQEICAKNKRSRNTYKGGHSLGRRSYAQRLDILKNEEPEKKHSRVDVWMAGCKRRDGTILEGVREKYEEVKEAHSKQCENLNDEDDALYNSIDINNDALTKVFGRDKRNRTRGVSSHISNKQLQRSAIAKVLLAQTSSSNAELKADVADIKSSMNTLMAIVNQGGFRGAASTQPSSATCTPGAKLGSSPNRNPSQPTSQNILNFMQNRECSEYWSTSLNLSDLDHCPPQPTPQNVMNYAQNKDCSGHWPGNRNGSVLDRRRSQPTSQNLDNSVQRKSDGYSSTDQKVVLLGKNMDAVAEGYIVTDITSGMCHFRKVMPGEKKVRVTKVFNESAPVYDGPQSEYMTMQDIVEGGYLIWLEARLEF